MRVLALSPGPTGDQLARLPALDQLCGELGATLQVACSPTHRSVWELTPALEKVIPIDLDSGGTLADWANLLGSVREPDFQVCLNFAEGRQVNLMLSMSHIPTRIAQGGFACTDQVVDGDGWVAQRLAPWLQPLGLKLRADSYRLTLPAAELETTRSQQPEGNGPLLLLAPAGGSLDWPSARWNELPNTIRTRLDGLRCMTLSTDQPLRRRAAAIACADVVLSSCPTTQLLAVYSGVPLVALGAAVGSLPERQDLRCLGERGDLPTLDPDKVLAALGF